jgi:BirA family biotin operon repressor/biotin-[acetyl-CoA-carboxylase] ligase
MDEVLLREHLNGLPVAALRCLEVTGSTNQDALRWAEQGADDFSLVIADRQTAGRGRLGRTWVTNPGAALAFSLILRPGGAEACALGLFSGLAAIAVSCALAAYGVRAEIKWPNDVLIRRKKTCGILAEASWSGAQLEALVLGIGVNVAPGSVPPPVEVMFPATCVESELGAPLDRFGLLGAILRELVDWRPRMTSPEFVAAWQERLAFVGEPVQVASPGQELLDGILLGIDREGGLRLNRGNHEILTVLAGDVRLRPHST